ncbi:MAG: hypothetical protein N2512_01680 [Armatimonadetes bacterium]|nr:hypothetical protein [Armatimonadota bacterium]
MRWLLGWFLSVTVATPTAAVAGDIPLWLVVPESGRPGVLVAQGAPVLRDAGFDVGSVRTGRAPRVLIVYPRAVTDEATFATVVEMVREGAGLVVVYSLSPDVTQRQAVLLEPWGVRLETAERSTGQTQVLAHPVTRGIERLFVWRTGASLEGVQALLRQGSNVIGGAAENEVGRLVVLPLDAVVPGQQSDPIPAPHLRLLVQAAQWAARVGEQRSGGHAGDADPVGTAEAQADAPVVEGEDVRPPELDVPAPGSRGRFSAVAAVDMGATDENWPAIRDIVVKLVTEMGLKPLDVLSTSAGTAGSGKSAEGRGAPEPSSRGTRVEKAPAARRSEGRGLDRQAFVAEPAFQPLIRAIEEDPALVVIGSCRQFTDDEELAVSAYVDSGGAVLFLPRVSERTEPRLVELNGVLAKFGLAALLGRPAGTVSRDTSRILAEVSVPGRLPAGVTVIGYRGLDLVKVGARSALRVSQNGAGRVAVLDPLPLLASKPDKALPEQWRRVLVAVLRWLLEGVQIGE